MEATRRVKQTELQKGFQKQAQNEIERQAKGDIEGETAARKTLAILMVQPWDESCQDKRILSFLSGDKQSLSHLLARRERKEGTISFEDEIGGHLVATNIRGQREHPHEILYEHCFGRVKKKSVPLPSTTHGMLKFPVEGGTVTLRSSMIIPMEYVFAWKPADITGVPRHEAEHRLNVWEGCLPIRQKKMGQAPERNKAI
ncbi:hypothetical protein Tco_0908722 [Tanacetum coccineum]|uniref:Uncharacterized protein n=1 Tax=Tanacetum coccineum TaxID=301880 RepID=A0ABQ5CQ20_9ASTR